MADWEKILSRGRVDDRRGLGGGVLAGGGIVSVLLLMGVTYLMGGNPLDVLLQTDPAVFQQSLSPEEAAQFEGEDDYEVFVSTILGSNNEYWEAEFTRQNENYTEPQLVLFRGQTSSACGGAASMVGPHYCPADNTIYLDETFFKELTSRFGAEGGDVAEAYVISHEVGHHVQHLLGVLQEDETNQDSIETELQADCFAGLWASTLKDSGVFAEGEINEAIDAAAAVGDDRIQSATRGQVHPETWTHGSSEQRVTAFNNGYNSASFNSCTR
ncbi:MAG TPA: neutral zinc metallopeptidase [Candidatus Paceibacterota bacterium]